MLAGDDQLALGKVKRLFVMSCEILRRSQHVEESSQSKWISGPIGKMHLGQRGMKSVANASHPRCPRQSQGFQP
jgi:hypothetical protein